MVGQRVWIIDKLASRCMYIQIDARQSPSGSSQYNLVCLYIVGETEQIQYCCLKQIETLFFIQYNSHI